MRGTDSQRRLHTPHRDRADRALAQSPARVLLRSRVLVAGLAVALCLGWIASVPLARAEDPDAAAPLPQAGPVAPAAPDDESLADVSEVPATGDPGDADAEPSIGKLEAWTQTHICELVHALDADTAAERDHALAELRDRSALDDLPLLERLYAHAVPGAQQLRLRAVMLGLGWVPPMDRARLAAALEDLKSPSPGRRADALVEAVRVENGARALAQALAVPPGRLALRADAPPKFVEHGEEVILSYRIVNIDDRGFWVLASPQWGSLPLMWTHAPLPGVTGSTIIGRLAGETPRTSTAIGRRLVNEIVDYQWLEPGDEVEIRQAYVNTHRPGRVSLTATYRNARRILLLEWRHPNQTQQASQEYTIDAWSGTLETTVTFASVPAASRWISRGRGAEPVSASARPLVRATLDGRVQIEFALINETSRELMVSLSATGSLARAFVVVRDGTNAIVALVSARPVPPSANTLDADERSDDGAGGGLFQSGSTGMYAEVLADGFEIAPGERARTLLEVALSAPPGTYTLQVFAIDVVPAYLRPVDVVCAPIGVSVPESGAVETD